jgi:hypothetical protein
MSLPWFRLYNETISDPKITTLSHEARWAWICCLCLASASAERGVLKIGNVPVTFRELSGIVSVTVDETRTIVSQLMERGMLSQREDGAYVVDNWERRQYSSDSSTDRVRKFRQKNRADETFQQRSCHVPETDQNTDSRVQITDTDSREVDLCPSDKDSSRPSVKTDPTPHQKIIDLYHEVCPTAPRVATWTEGAKHLKARWREAKERQNLMWWYAFFQRVAASDFLSGRKAGRSGPFFASLAWMVKAGNFEKILNGAYDSRTAGISYGDPEDLLKGMLQVQDKAPRSLREEIPDIAAGIVDTEGRIVDGEV